MANETIRNLSKRADPAVLIISAVIAAALTLLVFTDTNKNIVTVKEELLTGLEPIGKCLYVYGGGWNEEQQKWICFFFRYSCG